MLRAAALTRLARNGSSQLQRRGIAPSRSRCTSASSQPKQASNPPPPPPPPPPAQSSAVQSPITWKLVAITAAGGTAGLTYYTMEREKRMNQISTSNKTIGRAAIGGEFSVLDANGKTFTEADLKGHWTVLYFGFTMCPDICPAELTKLSDALTQLEKRGREMGRDATHKILPVFVSVDPERDSPARSHEYAAEFHPAFIGLSADVERIRAMAKKYRVYYSKDGGEGDDYLVDHSIITFLMDPNGDFQEFYTKNASAVEIASRIEAKMMAWKAD